MGSLQAHKQRMNRASETTLQQAFQSRLNLKKKSEDTRQGNSNRGRGRSSCGRGKGRGRGFGQPRNTSTRGNNSNSGSCSHCERSNNEEKDCWYKEKND